MDNGDLVQTRFAVIMDLPEEVLGQPHLRISPLVMVSPTHTPNPTPVTTILEAELIQPVAYGTPQVKPITHTPKIMPLASVEKLPTQKIVEILPLVAYVEPRRSIRLKVKGTHNSNESGTSRAALHSNSCPLFDNFFFN
jgi:hypothetical protein